MNSTAPKDGPFGVIFDMDGVLVDSYAPHLESWRKLARELGRDITDAQFDATFGRTSREIIRLLFGEQWTDADVHRLDARKEALYRDIVRGHVPAMPGVLALIRSLHAGGVRIAIGSSGPPENVALIIEEMGLKEFVSAQVTGADVSRGKPDPQVFQLAAARLGLPAARCVVIEDAPVGIEAARRAGCKVVGLVGTHAATLLSDANLVVTRLDDLTPAHLRRLIDLA